MGEGDAVASERLSAPRGLRRWRVRATRCGERAATRARAGPRGGVGRAAGQAGRPERGKGKRDERVGPASWAVGLVTGPSWVGVLV